MTRAATRRGEALAGALGDLPLNVPLLGIGTGTTLPASFSAPKSNTEIYDGSSSTNARYRRGLRLRGAEVPADASDPRVLRHQPWYGDLWRPVYPIASNCE